MSLQSDKRFFKIMPLVSAMAIVLSACGGGGGGSSAPANTAPKVNNATLNTQTLETKKLVVVATDAEKDTLTYSIKQQPAHGTASIDAKTGELTYTAPNIVGSNTIVVSVSDGKLTTDATISVTTQVTAAFDYQFYSTPNPETGNVQIVRYDPNDSNASTNQKVIKNNIILGDRVFVLSAAKDGDKNVYKKREYAVFLDPGASSEKRVLTASDGSTTEYTFYTNNILKKFDAANPSSESTIFTSTMLGSKLGGEGLSAIGDTYGLYVNETDINNSYVELHAFSRLPDTLKGELPETIKNTYVTVRLSDGKVTQGRTIKPVINTTTGKTDKVLVNYIAAHVAGSYPTAASEAARLQSCTADLATCTDLGTQAKGTFYFLAENDTHIYVTKEGSKKIYAFNKTTNAVAQVTGAEYPAAFDPTHHLIARGLDHGGSGVLSDFSSLTITNNQLSEGNAAYRVINYNLDTQDGVYALFGSPQKIHKNAQILKFEGTTATKVYDNGTGVDLENKSDAIKPAGHLNLIAVKNGNLFVELGKYDADTAVNVLSAGWIKSTTSTKTALDTVVTQQNVPYFTAHQIPSVAVGDKVFVVEVPRDNGTSGNDTNGKRIYNVYGVALTDTTSTKANITPIRGRMFFERTAARSSGVYEGSVITWNIANGEVRNASNNTVVGIKTVVPGDAGEDVPVSNAIAGNTGNRIGVGGLFGLHLATSHGGDYYLTSGISAKPGSLTVVNRINGSWIYD